MKDAAGRLFSIKDPYDLRASNDVFVEALRDVTMHHMDSCPDYARIMRSFNFTPGALRTVSDIHKLPAIPVLALRENPLYSQPPETIKRYRETSGTTGEPFSAGYGKADMRRSSFAAIRLMRRHRLFSLRPAFCLVMDFKPARGTRRDFVRFSHHATFLSPAVKKTYALGAYKDDGDYILDFEHLAGQILKYSEKKTDIRIYGQTSFLFYFLQYLKGQGFRAMLTPSSLILTGGGFKEFYADRVPESELIDLASETLGLDRTRFTGVFTAAEHGLPYFHCANHHYHVTAYSRVLVRDFQTLAPLGFNASGLLNLISPLSAAMPLTSILTDDVAVMRDGKSCGCGIESPFFEILGRAGMPGGRTYAETLTEILTQLPEA